MSSATSSWPRYPGADRTDLGCRRITTDLFNEGSQALASAHTAALTSRTHAAWVTFVTDGGPGWNARSEHDRTTMRIADQWELAGGK